MMRWNLDETPDLSPDLEWMLQSGQASRHLVAEALLEAFYPSVFSLAFAYLGDEKTARTAATRSFCAALANSARYRPTLGVKAWLFRQAVPACRRAGFQFRPRLRKRADLPFETEYQGEPDSSGPSDLALWKAVQKLPGSLRMVVLLRCLSDFEEREIALILGKTEGQVQGRLERAWKQLQAGSGQLTDNQPERIELRLSRMLSAAIPDRQVSGPDLQRHVADVFRQADRLRWIAPLGELLWIGFAVLAALGLAWSSRPAAPNPDLTPVPPGAYTPYPTQTPDYSVNYYAQPGETLLSISEKTGIPLDELIRINPYTPDTVFNRPRRVALPAPRVQYAPTPVPPLSDGPNPLTAQSLPLRLKQRLSVTQPRWETLWVDAQLINYGPPGYVGPSQAYRTQVWISLPDKSIQLVGPIGGTPFYRILVEGKYNYFFSQEREVSWYSESPELLVSWSPLPGLIFPARAEWLDAPGGLQIAGEEESAGRAAIIADWKDLSGQRLKRLWVDAQTGVILHQREFGGADHQVVIADYFVTAITYNASFPPELFDPSQNRLENVQDFLGLPQPSQKIEQLSDLTAPVQRQALQRQPAPAGFDPAQSPLTFQFPEDTTGRDSIPRVELFAGRFYLGRVPFVDPWNMLCNRSPDGRRLAFTLKPGWQQSRSTFADGLQWLDLGDLKIHTSPSPIKAASFAFAPDSRRLAVFSYPAGSTPGIDLVDTETGEITRLIDLEQAESLAWSPDGKHLALVGKRPGGSALEALVLLASSGHIVYSAPVDLQAYQQALAQPGQDLEWPASDWPGHSWGIHFPVRMGELEACAAPPE